MSAYRSELGGLYGIACVLEDLCAQYKLSHGHVTIGCDGKEALWQALGSNSPISPSASDFDIIAAIRRKIQRLPITTAMQWIKGHQDSASGSAHLDLWAKLNISMDLLAKQRRALHDRQAHPDDLGQDIDDEPWQLFLGRTKVSKNLPSRLFRHCATPALEAYWKSRRTFATTTADLHPDALEKAQHSQSWAHRCSRAKRITGILGVAKNLQRWNHQPHSRCPRCGDGPEDMLHVLTCPAADLHWTTAWNSIIPPWSVKNPTSAGVLDSIKLHLDHWRKSLPAPDTSFCTRNLRTALKAQSKIGWQNFLDGFIAHQWDVVQAEFYEETRSRRSPVLWLAGLINQMWNLSHAMWSHRNAAQHATSPELALTLEASVDQSIQDHFTQGFNDLDRRRSAPLFRGGIRYILSKPFPTKIQWLQNLIAARERQWRILGRRGPDALMTPERALIRRWLSLGTRRSARNPAHR
jgi:hypothetical protein